MEKHPDLLKFEEAKEDILENLEAIKLNLSRCVDAGMIDTDATYYNELLDLIDDADLSDTWDELMEVVAKGKTIEVDVDTWLSLHGQTSLSLPWPKRGSTK